MKDRELLELAAKAAGIEIQGFLFEGETLKFADIGWEDIIEWNPLQDDGDALRLAVKLRIHISLYKKDGVAAWIIKGEATKFEEDGADTYADTRRAIVRAAAEIGKSL